MVLNETKEIAVYNICVILKSLSNINYSNNTNAKIAIWTASPQKDLAEESRRFSKQKLQHNYNKFPENPYNKQTHRMNENNVKIHLVYKLPGLP